MRPDAPALDAVGRAEALWDELTRAYDEIARVLRGGDWRGLEALVARMTELEPVLRAVTAAPRPVVTDSEEAARWRALDTLARELAARRAVLEERARAARDATAAELARLLVARAQVAGYRAPTAPRPRFTSRRI